jgi:hypothetical protein
LNVLEGYFGKYPGVITKSKFVEGLTEKFGIHNKTKGVL